LQRSRRNPDTSVSVAANPTLCGLIRQYFPKRQTMRHVTQADCDLAIASTFGGANDSTTAHPKSAMTIRTS